MAGMTSPEQAAAVRAAFAAAGVGSKRRRGRVSVSRIEAAIATLGDLTMEDLEELDERYVRDEISHVIDALDRVVERRRARGRT